jgi:hypothetical protein
MAIKNFEQGIPVLVREDGDTERPDSTHATYRLRNPDEVEAFLRQLVTLNEQRKSQQSTDECGPVTIMQQSLVLEAEESGEVMGPGKGFTQGNRPVEV